MVLVNKLNKVPEDWEKNLETVHITNSVGDDVEVEKKAFEAYEKLKADLEETEGIYLELDSALRGAEVQQEIMDDFIEKYGADYAARTVALPGYSEHHTGLALDLYFKLKDEDGSFIDFYYNEDIVQYPEIWEKIHARLAENGFILRYPEGKEHITGYGYEPWHIRYINDPETAGKIMSRPGMTLEVWLGAASDHEVIIDYGHSELYTEEELELAAIQVKCGFAFFRGCELHGIRYAGDEENNEENLMRLNSLREGSNYTRVMKFFIDFQTAGENTGEFAPDQRYTDYPWRLGAAEDGGFEVVSFGY